MSQKHFMLEQWSRGLAELAADAGTERFIATLLASVKRLVDFDFLMAFAYRGTDTPLLLGDTLDAARHRIIATDYVAGPFLLDPFFGLVRDGKRAGCHRLHSVAPDHFRRSEYFRMHYSRTGIGEEICVIFDLGAGLTGVTSFARWVQSPPILRNELAICQAIEGAIGAFCAKHWSNLQGTGQQAQTADAISRFGFGVLSAREHEIVTLVLQGHSTESVALHLDISPGTVKIHRKNIYRKMKVSSQAELFAAFLGFTGKTSRNPGYSQGDMAGPPKITHLLPKSS